MLHKSSRPIISIMSDRCVVLTMTMSIRYMVLKSPSFIIIAHTHNLNQMFCYSVHSFVLTLYLPHSVTPSSGSDPRVQEVGGPGEAPAGSDRPLVPHGVLREPPRGAGLQVRVQRRPAQGLQRTAGRGQGGPEEEAARREVWRVSDGPLP